MIEILNKLKIFEYNRIQNFSNNIDLRKQVFLSSEKISKRSCFVNKDVMQSFFCSSILRDFSLWLDRLSGDATDTWRGPAM